MADKQVTINVVANVEDGEVQGLEQLIENIKNETTVVDVNVEDGEVLSTDAEIENLNQTAHVDIDVDDAAVQGAMQNINDGINQAKQGIGEIAAGMGEALEASGRMENTETFLSMNIGADKAKAKLDEIRSVTDKLPGDDVTLQNLLSQATVKDMSMGADAMTLMGGAAADYMAAMQNFGKNATETQQDLMNYILAGNTAEVERSPILQSHIDKLKEGTTVQERAKLLQEALNEEGWKGISQQDTYNNKLQQFDDMMTRGQMNLGNMFNEGAKGAMSFLMGLDDATGGLAGMALVATTQFGPGLFSATQGIVTMVPGIQQLIKGMGGLGGIIPTITGAIGGAGSSLMALATGPVGIAIAAIALLAIGIYEAGKAFGWWSDVGSMLDAMKAGVMELWNAFMSNPYVIQAIDLIKQGLTDAWNAIQGFGQAIMTALGGAGGQFDILGFMVQNLGMILNAVMPIVIMVIQGIITYFRNLYTVAVTVWPMISGAISNAIGIIRGIISGAMSIWSGLQSAWRGLQSTASSVFGAINGIVSGAGSAWHSFSSTVMSAIQPIIDQINNLKNAAAGVGDLVHSIGFGGIETPSVSGGGYYGATTVTQGNTIIFNMYGDIRDEKTLDDTIDAINNRIQFEGLANGTIDNGGGAI